MFTEPPLFLQIRYQIYEWGKKTEYDVTLDPRTGKPHAVNVTGPGRSTLDDKSCNNTERNTRYNAAHGGWNLQSIDNENNRSINNNWQMNNNNNQNMPLDHIIPEDLKMTVTIDNDNVMNRYRQNNPYTGSMNMTNHWEGHHYEHQNMPYDNSRQSYYPHNHNNPYNNFNKSKHHLSNDMLGNLREYNNHYVTSPRYDNVCDRNYMPRYHENQQQEYDDYSSREYWRYENDMHFQQHGYDYNRMHNYNDYRNYDSSNRNNFR